MPELSSKNAKPENLLLILEQKLAAFKEFLSATILLKEHLLSGGMQQIDSVIARRQELAHRIDSLDDRIKKMGTSSGTNPPGTASERNKQIDALSSALEETITKVIALNEECAAIAAHRRDGLAKEVAQVSNGRLAMHGYASCARGGSSNGTPRFLSVDT